MNFQKSEGIPRVPQNYLAASDCKSGLISTLLALLGLYGLQSAQNSLIALRITPLGPPNSKMGCYFKIGQALVDLRPIYRDRTNPDILFTVLSFRALVSAHEWRSQCTH